MISPKWCKAAIPVLFHPVLTELIEAPQLPIAILLGTWSMNKPPILWWFIHTGAP